MILPGVSGRNPLHRSRHGRVALEWVASQLTKEDGMERSEDEIEEAGTEISEADS